jgi:HSP20 family protein
VKVDVTDVAITIQGERRREHEEDREGYYRSERSYGSFYRTVPLPDGAMTDQAKATFKDGVLEIRMPAPPEQVTRGRRRAVDVRKRSIDLDPLADVLFQPGIVDALDVEHRACGGAAGRSGRLIGTSLRGGRRAFHDLRVGQDVVLHHPGLFCDVRLATGYILFTHQATFHGRRSALCGRDARLRSSLRRRRWILRRDAGRERQDSCRRAPNQMTSHRLSPFCCDVAVEIEVEIDTRCNQSAMRTAR